MSLFQEPPPTRYDLRFGFLGIPVRVHPAFWIMGVLLGYSTNLINLLIWVAVVFVSILIHELGHSLAFRMYGISSHIVLHIMGGLAIPDGWGFGSGRRASIGNVEQIIISLAGPFAGFLFAALLISAATALGGNVSFAQPIPLPQAFIPFGGRYANLALNSLLWINIFWGLFNLIPVFPLDGGQVARHFLTILDPQNGFRTSLWLSVIFGAAAAIGGFVMFNSIFITLIFGLLAFQSYQMLNYR